MLDRSVDDHVPNGLLNEFIDLVFLTALDSPHEDDDLYRAMLHSSGLAGAGNPHAGYQHALTRDLAALPWERVLDLFPRMARTFEPTGQLYEFVTGANRILAGYNMAWDLTNELRLERVVDEETAAIIEETDAILAAPEFDAARELFEAGLKAFNDRPMRPREACDGLYDATESVAKVVANIPNGTLGRAADALVQNDRLDQHVRKTVQALETVRNNHFGHGGPREFSLELHEIAHVVRMAMSTVILLASVPREGA